MNNYFDNVLKEKYIPFEKLKNKTVMVTGATGLIGKMTIKALLYINKNLDLTMHIIALARNEEKVKEIYKNELVEQKECLNFIFGDITDKLNIAAKADYIIHTAAPTESRFFITNPVDVIETSIIGTKNILDYAKECQSESVLYLSSMEAYGFTTEEKLLTEDNMQYLNPLEIRSCYPESKRMAENMCIAYHSQYNVPVKIIRLAQTFGYGINKNESRAFMEFAKCALDGKDIVLLTDGKSKRMYLDTVDAVTAILTVLLKGENGKAYNAANKETYCSIFDMANIAGEVLGNNGIKVTISVNEQKNKKFPPAHKLNLDVSKIENLGWKAKTNLREMYKRFGEEIFNLLKER